MPNPLFKETTTLTTVQSPSATTTLNVFHPAQNLVGANTLYLSQRITDLIFWGSISRPLARRRWMRWRPRGGHTMAASLWRCDSHRIQAHSPIRSPAKRRWRRWWQRRKSHSTASPEIRDMRMCVRPRGPRPSLASSRWRRWYPWRRPNGHPQMANPDICDPRMRVKPRGPR